ncbi:Arc family DNA-binding protein [Chromobacterium haemolyticum]|uniref:Arc family DNA-binding protein n=1 Tax=Chromobacterium haemolyticum TaxID=394935 RepID=UPI0005940FCA|nr:Arc family DNA-binding protein [Chromobacterium haemolyticum]
MEHSEKIWRTQVRFPAEVEEWVKQRAKKCYRSANSVLLDIVMQEKAREEKCAAEAKGQQK